MSEQSNTAFTEQDFALFESVATRDGVLNLDLYCLLAVCRSLFLFPSRAEKYVRAFHWTQACKFDPAQAVIFTAANQPENVTTMVQQHLRTLGDSVPNKVLFLTRIREALLKASLICGIPRVCERNCLCSIFTEMDTIWHSMCHLTTWGIGD